MGTITLERVRKDCTRLGNVKGNALVDNISKSEVPLGRIVTYANFVYNYRSLMREPYRIRLTVGGNKLECTDGVASPAASLLESKLLVNSTISDAHCDARFLTLDINNFFLKTYMKRKVGGGAAI